MRVTSPAFSNNELIPSLYTCNGQNVNPSLVFHDTPANTQSLALIVHDPDAPSGDFTHWIVWNIPHLQLKIPTNSVPIGSSQGLNDTGQVGYTGPCPPSGTHRYFFDVYALALNNLNLTPNETLRSELESAINNFILDQASIIGLYRQ